MEKCIVWLRGVNVGGHRKLVMTELRAAMIAAGHGDCVTYIQSGNLVFSAANAATAEAAVEAVIEREYGLKTVAVARSATVFAMLAATNPFADALPKLLHLGLTKRPPAPGAQTRIEERAAAGERIAIIGDAVWIDYGSGGVGATRLTPAFLDKATGSTLTARNINTVAKLIGMSAA